MKRLVKLQPFLTQLVTKNETKMRDAGFSFKKEEARMRDQDHPLPDLVVKGMIATHHVQCAGHDY